MFTITSVTNKIQGSPLFNISKQPLSVELFDLLLFWNITRTRLLRLNLAWSRCCCLFVWMVCFSLPLSDALSLQRQCFKIHWFLHSDAWTNVSRTKCSYLRRDTCIYIEFECFMRELYLCTCREYNLPATLVFRLSRIDEDRWANSGMLEVVYSEKVTVSQRSVK